MGILLVVAWWLDASGWCTGGLKEPSRCEGVPDVLAEAVGPYLLLNVLFLGPIGVPARLVVLLLAEAVGRWLAETDR